MSTSGTSSASGHCAIRNGFKFPLQSVALQIAAGEMNTGGIMVPAGGVVRDLSESVALDVCKTSVFQLSRDNGKTWELEPGQFGPNGETSQ